MKNKVKIASCILALGVIVTGRQVALSEGGSDRDPLVSRSYVEKRVDDIVKYIDSKISGSGNIEAGETRLEVVEIKKGESLIAGQGTEIILRSGSAMAIGSELGGISDVTAGVDIPTYEYIRPNHQLIIPRDDGRGIYAAKDCICLVKGPYSIGIY